jgi:ribosomal protein S18 acetylase RimI-like enzyme
VGGSDPPRIAARPMTQAEFDAYLGWAVPEYADELERNTGIGREAAEQHAARSYRDALPDGIATPEHAFLTAQDADTGEHVGLLWLARQRRDGADVIWVFDVWVEEAMRGRGYGRRLMELAEERAVASGVRRLELNVYRDNERARRLYASLGYVEMSRQMFKPLGGA